ncbi:MAG: hypothetical protein JST68_20650 [Bacteroidetes bacterium]|nr:hypothetical protein [Bacteroidota bacterium]
MMLRLMDGYETMFWLLDQTRAVHFVMAAEIDGRAPETRFLSSGGLPDSAADTSQ